MRKLVLSVLLLSVGVMGFAQNASQEAKYRRSSLYTIMLPDDKLADEQKEIVAAAFLEKAFPDKYNNHCLSERVLDLAAIKAIPVTQEEIDAAEKEGAAGKKGIGGLAKGLGGLMKSKSNGEEKKLDENSDAAYVARLQKYFKDNKVAQKMVAKWVGGGETKPAAAQAMSQALIEERGMQTLSQDEITTAKEAGNYNEVCFNAMMDLLPKTFVMVNRYSYLSAEDIITYITAAASVVGGGYATLAGAGLAAGLKGYFVKTSTFLFQLDLDQNKINELAEKYTNDISGIYDDDSYKLKYVGKTWDYAPAALSLSLNEDAMKKLISRATVRATDGAISKLQDKYEQFKTLSTLHQDGDQLFAYIGMKEGVKKGDKFEVLQMTVNKKTGKEEFKAIKTVKVEKDGVWDNREGAGEVIEGAASGKEDDDANESLKYTKLGTSKDLLDGSLIRQVK